MIPQMCGALSCEMLVLRPLLTRGLLSVSSSTVPRCALLSTLFVPQASVAHLSEFMMFNQPARQPGSQPGSQTARQPDSQAARRPGSQAARQPGSQAARQPGRWPGSAREAIRHVARDSTGKLLPFSSEFLPLALVWYVLLTSLLCLFRCAPNM